MPKGIIGICGCCGLVGYCGLMGYVGLVGLLGSIGLRGSLGCGGGLLGGSLGGGGLLGGGSLEGVRGSLGVTVLYISLSGSLAGVLVSLYGSLGCTLLVSWYISLIGLDCLGAGLCVLLMIGCLLGCENICLDCLYIGAEGLLLPLNMSLLRV